MTVMVILGSGDGPLPITLYLLNVHSIYNTIEYKLHGDNWKAIQISFPNKTLKQVENHATAFFSRIETFRPSNISMLEFIRKNHWDALCNITFDVPQEIEEVKKPIKKVYTNFDGIDSFMTPIPTIPEHIPTQSQVISNTLKSITNEMMRLMQDLMTEMQENKDIKSDKNAEGYWAYIYSSAVYLQQLISDVTVAHNSVLRYIKRDGKSDNALNNNGN